MRPQCSRHLLPLLIVVVLAVSACTADPTGSDESFSTTSSSTEGTSSPTASTTALPAPPTTTSGAPRRTTTTSTAPPDPLAESEIAAYGDFGPDLPIGANTGPYSGSGCEVGDDVIPDGLWFGHILAYEVAATPDTLHFDLACVEQHGFTNLVANRSVRLRDLPIGSETKFVFARDQLILTPRDDAAAITAKLSRRHDVAWGWALLEGGITTEFYIPGFWDWQGHNVSETESLIPRLLYPDPATDQVLTGDDGFDGSGCSPPGGSLPDGLWFGTPRFTAPDEVHLDLRCSISVYEKMVEVGIDPEWVEDRTAIDDGDDTEYRLTIAPEAVMFMTFFDGNYFQTPLDVEDPRYLHMVNGPQPPFDYTPGLWVKVEQGVVVEGYNFFSP